MRTAISPIVPLVSTASQVHHFVTAGWSPLHCVGEFPDSDPGGVIGDLVFRIGDGSDIEAGVERAATIASSSGRHAVVLVELPRGSESAVFDDDEAVIERVAQAARVALDHGGVSVFLDAFMDHDRGYYPRHGLLDRAYNPRPALYRLIEAASERRSWTPSG